jgi:hypothetical protein
MTMTSALSRLALLCAGAMSAALAPATPAAAEEPYYAATLADPAPAWLALSAGVVWTCQGSACRARRDAARPVDVCRNLARQVGEVAAFMADGRALSARALRQCNRRTALAADQRVFPPAH